MSTILSGTVGTVMSSILVDFEVLRCASEVPAEANINTHAAKTPKRRGVTTGFMASNLKKERGNVGQERVKDVALERGTA